MVARVVFAVLVLLQRMASLDKHIMRNRNQLSRNRLLYQLYPVYAHKQTTIYCMDKNWIVILQYLLLFIKLIITLWFIKNKKKNNNEILKNQKKICV